MKVEINGYRKATTVEWGEGEGGTRYVEISTGDEWHQRDVWTNDFEDEVKEFRRLAVALQAAADFLEMKDA